MLDIESRANRTHLRLDVLEFVNPHEPSFGCVDFFKVLQLDFLLLSMKYITYPYYSSTHCIESRRLSMHRVHLIEAVVAQLIHETLS